MKDKKKKNHDNYAAKMPKLRYRTLLFVTRLYPTSALDNG